jgi:hypothetical protein
VSGALATAGGPSGRGLDTRWCVTGTGTAAVSVQNIFRRRRGADAVPAALKSSASVGLMCGGGGLDRDAFLTAAQKSPVVISVAIPTTSEIVTAVGQGSRTWHVKRLTAALRCCTLSASHSAFSGDDIDIQESNAAAVSWTILRAVSTAPPAARDRL